MLPLVTALRNPHLRPLHFDQLDVLVFGEGGGSLPRGDALTLSACLSLGLHVQSALVAKLSSDATQEAALLELLEKVKAQWADVEFTVRPFKESSKDALVLGGVDDVMVVLEETAW